MRLSQKDNDTAMRKFVLGLLLVVVIVSGGGYYFLQSKETPSLLENYGKGVFDLIAHWSQGNIVALIRHTERCDDSNNPCLDGEDGITIIGKETALKIGENFKKLPDQETIFYNSPFKRTNQTAYFMFGTLSVDQKWLIENCKDNLYQEIFNHKEKGKNLVLITHSTCIDKLGEKEGNDLLSIDILDDKTYGISIFLAVDKDAMRAHVLGYLYPRDWEKVVW